MREKETGHDRKLYQVTSCHALPFPSHLKKRGTPQAGVNPSDRFMHTFDERDVIY
jgi:hypothetical protein